MEHKCGQISIQHIKVFIETFSVTWDQKNFCQLLSEKGKKECLKSRTDVVEQQNKSFSNKCPLDPSRLQLMFLRYWKAEKILHPDYYVKRLVQVSKLTLQTQKSVPKPFKNDLKQAYLINNGLYSNNHLSQASAKNKNKSFQLGSLVKLYFSLFYLTVKV